MRKGKLTHAAAWLTLPMIVCLLVRFPLPLPASEEKAPGTGKLKGFIYKADAKTALWGAQVLLKNAKTGQLFESNVTDSVGDYRLKDIPAGDYAVKILVKDKSYKVKTVDFQVKIFEGKTSTISYALKKYRKFPLIFGLRICKIIAFLAGIAAIAVAVF